MRGWGLVAVLMLVGTIPAQEPAAPRTVIAQSGIAAPPLSLQTGQNPLPSAAISSPELGEKCYPISLGTALKLAGVKPLDIQIADQQVLIANRQLDRAKLLWVPNIVTGLDYFRHEGGQQNFAGDIVRSSRGSFNVGVGPNAVVSLSEAIYAPLAAKQDLKARYAARQAVENDTMLAVCEAYFWVQQSRGELAGATLAYLHAEDLAGKAEKLAEGLAPPLEASRAKVELARRKQATATARERWRVASADLVRLLRLEPGTLIEPIEATFLPVTVIDPNSNLDGLIPIALTSRPELAGHQAVVKATLTRLDQEKLRPLVPSIALRSTSTNPSGSIGWGGFGGGPNDKLQSFGSRMDLDLQVLWEFQSLGFGNKARVGERRAEHQAATLDLFRTQDRIASEVSIAFAQAKAASERMTQAEPALKEARELVEKSLQGMGQTKRMGDSLVLIVRPQEVVAAVQLFALANADFYSAVGDYNRAQFRLYRALGHPANGLAGLVAPDVVTHAEMRPLASNRATVYPQNSITAKNTPEVTQANFHVVKEPPLRANSPVTIAQSQPTNTVPMDLPVMRKMISRAGSVSDGMNQGRNVPNTEPASLPLNLQPVIAPAKPSSPDLEWHKPKDSR